MRRSRAGDIQPLKNLWKIAFGDSDVYINGFFDHNFSEGSAVLAECSGLVTCAIHLMPAGSLKTQGGLLSCVYAYALATLPEWRNRGLASRVASFAIESSRESFDCNIIRPAEVSLFPFYEAAGYRPFFSIDEREVLAQEVPVYAGERARLCKVSPAQYAVLREGLLPALSVSYGGSFLAYQGLACEKSGGGFFAVEALGAGLSPGCAAIEVAENGRVFVKELLLPGVRPDAALSCIKSHFPAVSYVVRSPGAALPFALAAFKEPQPVSTQGYFSFVLD